MNAAKKPQRTLRCAIYTRKSTEEGLEQEFNSLDAQRENCESYIKSQQFEGWQCLATQYDDGGFTGANMERPGLRRLLADIEAGLIDCVVVYKVDRLSRSLIDFTRIVEIFDRHNVAFVSVTQAFNTASSMGRLILNVLLSFAQFEREMISERTRDKIAAARRKGKWSGGIPLLGYTVVNTKLIVDPIEARRVQEIFDLYLQLQSTLAVAKEINGRGWRTKEWTTKKAKQCGGMPFNKNSLYALLSNVTYTGKIRYKDQIYPGEHAAIIDPGTFDRVQEILRFNGRSQGKAGRSKHNALLQGLLRCGTCDCGMSHTYTQKGSRLYRYYVCHRAQKRGWDSCPAPSLPAGEIEDFVLRQIRDLGQDPGVIRDTLAQTRSQTHSLVERLKQEKRELDRALRDGCERLAKWDGVDGKEAHLAELQRKIREQEQRQTEINSELAVHASLMIDESDVRAALGTFDELWQSLKPSERSGVINQVVERITYDGGSSNLAITYHPLGIKTLATDQLSPATA